MLCVCARAKPFKNLIMKNIKYQKTYLCWKADMSNQYNLTPNQSLQHGSLFFGKCPLYNLECYFYSVILLLFDCLKITNMYKCMSWSVSLDQMNKMVGNLCCHLTIQPCKFRQRFTVQFNYAAKMYNILAALGKPSNEKKGI